MEGVQMAGVIAEYKSLGMKVTLYQNRLEYNYPGKKEMIPYRNIASIEKPPLLSCLDITTNDGEKHRISLTSMSKINELKAQIEDLL